MDRTFKSRGVLAAIGAAAVVCIVAAGALAQRERDDRNDVQKKPDRPAAGKQGQMMMCPMMAGLGDVKLFAESPAVLRARAEELNLTAEQKKRLEAIERAARKQAREVLTAEQREELADAPERPLSVMELSRMGMKKRDGKEAGMMCPMCARMMRMHKDETEGKEKRPDSKPRKRPETPDRQ